MGKKIFVFRALPENRDSRTVRYKNIKNSHVILNTWENKNNECKGLDKLKLDKESYSKKISYPLYLIYLFLYSLFHIKNDDSVICMELDTFLPVYLGSFMKKSKIYFDIVDPIAETKFKNVCCNSIFDRIEIFLLKYRKYNILPNHNRVDYYVEKYGISPSNFKYSIIENVPLIQTYNSESKKHYYNLKNKFTIGYFGTLEEERGLFELIDFVNKNDLNLIIAGDGKLKERIIKKSKISNNIVYKGRYNYREIGKLFEDIDFLWAYYSHKNFLHKFASPNKYYEHLAFKTPIIMNSYVPQSQEIVENNTGIIIDNELTDENFQYLLDKIYTYRYDIADFSDWEKKYSNYEIILKK